MEQLVQHQKMINDQLARYGVKFGLPYVVMRKPEPIDTTTLNYNWQVWETNAFSVYTKETDEIDEQSAQQAVAAVLRYLSRVGLLRYHCHSGYLSAVVQENEMTNVLTPAGGIFRRFVEPGQEVEYGQTLGVILDPFTAEEVPFSVSQLGPREIVREDLRGGLALLSQGAGTPLAQPDSVTVAFCRKGKTAVLITHCKTGAAQPQSLPQGRADDGLAADGDPGNVPGGRQAAFAEPALRRGQVRCKVQPGQQGLQLLRRHLDGIEVVVSRPVSGAVHRDQIGQGRPPDVLAGFGHAVGDGKIACPGGGTIVVEDIAEDGIHQR